MNRHVEKVKEDIRSGRTELVWEEDKESGTPATYLDAFENESAYKEDKWFATIDLFDNYFIMGSNYNKGAFDWHEGENVPKAQAKIQELYHEYLMLQAKKLDEGEA